MYDTYDSNFMIYISGLSLDLLKYKTEWKKRLGLIQRGSGIFFKCGL